MITSILAAVFTFTATATGVDKGTPLEFMFACKDTDRDYETMFVIDGTVDEFWKGIEKAGIPRGQPIDRTQCRLWPVGVPLRLEPGLDTFVDSEMPEGLPLGEIIYTGGSRDEKGCADASSNMPGAVFALYTLPQSFLLFNGIYEQGAVYGSHKAKVSLKKGEKRTFSLKWDEVTRTQSLQVEFKSGLAKECLTNIRKAAERGEVSVEARFCDEMTVGEATAVATALAQIDSVRVKINGCRPGDFFFRAFLPLTSWKDRKERLTQPFEVTLGNPDKIVFIEEDWSGDGVDPKLTEKIISYDEMKRHPKTDTVFFYVTKETTLKTLKTSLAKVPKTVLNHYVYWE